MIHKDYIHSIPKWTRTIYIISNIQQKTFYGSTLFIVVFMLLKKKSLFIHPFRKLFAHTLYDMLLQAQTMIWKLLKIKLLYHDRKRYGTPQFVFVTTVYPSIVFCKTIGIFKMSLFIHKDGWGNMMDEDGKKMSLSWKAVAICSPRGWSLMTTITWTRNRLHEWW